MEKWKQITFAPKYEVSNMGRIRNRESGYVLKPISPNKTSHKQLQICLRCGIWGKEQHTISQIVYNHWCLKDGENPTYYEHNEYKVKNNRIGHYDGNVANNKMKNLYRY